MTTDRRAFLRRLAAAGLAAPFVLQHAAAQMQHGHGMTSPMTAALPSATGPDVFAPHAIPWDDGSCAFCNMTLRTPSGAAAPAGFRERTYAQIRLGDGAEANEAGTLHYESIACMFNHAFVEGLRDGHGATYYVAAVDAAPSTEADLLLARSAAYLWAENLQVSMNARIGALADDAALMAFVVANPELGRHQRYDAVQLADLAPLPSNNLIPLLARHAGLVDG